MSAEVRYYYVDAQNQAAGPIAMAGLLALKSAGTITDASLVVAEGGTEWVAFSTLKAEGVAKGGAGTLQSSAPEGLRSEGGQPAASSTPVSQTTAGTAPVSATSSGAAALQSSSVEQARTAGGSSAAEPLWASQLTQKIDQLSAAMDKLSEALEKSRPAMNPAPVLAPATAALHAEKINLNPVPKPGIAALNPQVAPRPTPLPTGVPIAAPKPAGLPVAASRPGVGTTLSPLAVPANAQKSPLPLPALGKAPGPAPAAIPKSAAPAKGNIFSKFLKK